jgi:hypothetical protein
MKLSALWCATLVTIVPAAPLAALEASDVERRSFELPRAADGRRVEIDNVFGPVTVRGGTGDRVDVTIHRRITADDASELERARAEVRLEVVEEAGRLELVQDGPFRDDCDERGGRRGRQRERDYEVEWSWEVTVPSDVALEVSTVLGDTVVVEGVAGELDVSNVNGAVRVVGARAATAAATVNGDVEVEYAVRPRAAMSFATVNGEIEIALPAGSGAELAFQTVNGEIFTDFPAAASARPAAVERERTGRGTRFRLGGESVVRLGDGGPRLAATTVNGDILIRER